MRVGEWTTFTVELFNSEGEWSPIERDVLDIERARQLLLSWVSDTGRPGRILLTVAVTTEVVRL